MADVFSSAGRFSGQYKEQSLFEHIDLVVSLCKAHVEMLQGWFSLAYKTSEVLLSIVIIKSSIMRAKGRAGNYKRQERSCLVQLKICIHGYYLIQKKNQERRSNRILNVPTFFFFVCFVFLFFLKAVAPGGQRDFRWVES